jgi:hypothetical protein
MGCKIFNIKASHVPLRAAAGAFILNSGVEKLSADEETAAGLHGFAATAYPFLNSLKPKTFARCLALGEIAVGAALLTPVVPSALAGLGLTAFSGGLLGLYARVPGLRQEGSLSPTQQGIPVAQDVWLLGIGLSLTVDGLSS